MLEEKRGTASSRVFISFVRLFAFIVSIFVMLAPRIGAAATVTKVENTGLGDGITAAHRFYLDGKLAYCMSSYVGTPWPGTTLSQYTGAFSIHQLDYVMYHGYGGSTTKNEYFSGLDDNHAYAGTQACVWTAVADRYRWLLDKGGTFFNDNWFNRLPGLYVYQEPTRKAAAKLMADAEAYARRGGGGVEAGASMIFLNPGYTQHLVTLNNPKKGQLQLSKKVENKTDKIANKNFEFTITLKNSNGNGVNATYSYTGSKSGSVKFTNGVGTVWLKDGETILFEKELIEGTTYTIVETPMKGFNVKSSSNLKGTIKEDTISKASVTNIYNPKGYWQPPSAMKKLVGRDELDASLFKFTIRKDSASGQLLETVRVGTAVGNGNTFSAYASFSKINYSYSDIGKTYKYFVSEVNTGHPGYTYDTHVIEYDVTVVDDGSGVLKTTVTTKGTPDNNTSSTFTNKYAASGSVIISSDKILSSISGKRLSAGQFTFNLYEGTVSASNLIATATNSANGKITFPAISYALNENQDDTGTHIYHITEVAGADPYIRYDSGTITVSVLVKDKGDGTLTATKTIVGAKKGFTNDFKTLPITIRKAVQSTTPVSEQKTFTFDVSLLNDEGEPLPGTWVYESISNSHNSPHNGTIKHGGTLTLNCDETVRVLNLPVGTQYSFTERSSAGFTKVASQTHSESGIVSNDSNVEGASTSVVVTNRYSASGSVSLSAKKVLNGQQLKDNQFTFNLYEGEVTPSNLIATATNNANGTISFPQIDYTQTDIGTHSYIITEVAGNDDSIIYDSDQMAYSVEVSDNGDGTLKVTKQLATAKKKFINDQAMGKITLEKRGNATSAASKRKTFVFDVQLLDKDGDPLSGNWRYRSLENEYNAPHNGTIRNGGTLTLNYGEKVEIELPVGTQYSFTERRTQGFERVASQCTNESGTVQRHQVVSAEVTNIYSAQGSTTISIEKTLEGREIAADQFTFNLYRNSVSDANLIATTTNDADGLIKFTLNYTQDDIGTHDYCVKEVSGTDEKIEYDSRTVTFRTEVFDNGDGTLNISKFITSNNKKFENKQAMGYITLRKVGQSLTNASKLRTFTFSVSLRDEEGNQLSGTYEYESVSNTNNNPHNGVIRNGGTITLNCDETVRIKLPLGTEYSFTERNTQGFTLVEGSCQNMSGTVQKDTTVSVVFTNRYSASGTFELRGYKRIPGRNVAADEFTFYIYDDAALSHRIATVKNDIAGAFKTNVTFNESHDGQTFYYYAKEKQGTDATLDYDTDTVLCWKIVPHDRGDGTMSADVSSVDPTTKEPLGTSGEIVNKLKPGNLCLQKTVDDTTSQLFRFRVKLTNRYGYEIDKEQIANNASEVAPISPSVDASALCSTRVFVSSDDNLPIETVENEGTVTENIEEQNQVGTDAAVDDPESGDSVNGDSMNEVAEMSVDSPTVDGDGIAGIQTISLQQPDSVDNDNRSDVQNDTIGNTSEFGKDDIDGGDVSIGSGEHIGSSLVGSDGFIKKFLIHSISSVIAQKRLAVL